MDNPRGEPPSSPRPVLRVVNPDEPAPEHPPTAQHHRRAGNATLPPAIIKLASRRRSLRKSRRGRGTRRDGRSETEAGLSGSTDALTSAAGNNENSSSSKERKSKDKGKDKGKGKGKEVENEDENENDDNDSEEKHAPPLTPTKRLRPPMPENVPPQESEHAPRRYQPYRPETFAQAQAQQQRQQQQQQRQQRHSLALPPPPPPTPTPLSIQPVTRPKTPSIIHELFPNGSIPPVTNPTTTTDPTRRQGVPPPPRPQSISTISYFTTQPPQRTDATAAAIRFPFTTTASTAAAADAAAASLPPHRIYRPNRWLGERTGEDRRAAAAQEVRDGLLLPDGSGGRTTKGKLARAMLWFCLALGPAWGVLLLVTSGRKRKV